MDYNWKNTDLKGAATSIRDFICAKNMYRIDAYQRIICAPVCTKSYFTTGCFHQQLGGTKHHTTEFASELAERSRKASVYWTCQDRKNTCCNQKHMLIVPATIWWLAFHIHPTGCNWDILKLLSAQTVRILEALDERAVRDGWPKDQNRWTNRLQNSLAICETQEPWSQYKDGKPGLVSR